MVKLRLTRLGRKKKPVYRIAAMEELTQRDGKAIAYLGTYNPLVEEGKRETGSLPSLKKRLVAQVGIKIDLM